MIIDTSDISKLDGITSAVFSEDAKGVSELTLGFSGYLPGWVQYMEPVVLMHRGKMLFRGKVSRLPQSNEAGEQRSSVVVSNILWLLEHQTLPQQLAEIEAALESAAAEDANSSQQGGGRVQSVFQGGLQQAARGMSAQELVDGVNLWTSGWTGELEEEEGTITASVSGALANRHSLMAARDGVRTTVTAFQALLEANPDAFFKVDYTSGTVRFLTIGEAPRVVWNAERQRVCSALELEPQYEYLVTAVALVVTGDEGIRGVWVYPPEADVKSTGVKVFQISIGEGQVERYEEWMKTAADYYAAASVLQWGGSMTTRPGELEESPLGTVVNLTGSTMRPEWASMAALVTRVSWDFMEDTVQLQFGRDLADPEFADPLEVEAPEEVWSESEEDSCSSTQVVTWDSGTSLSDESITGWSWGSWSLGGSSEEESVTGGDVSSGSDVSDWSLYSLSEGWWSDWLESEEPTVPGDKTEPDDKTVPDDKTEPMVDTRTGTTPGGSATWSQSYTPSDGCGCAEKWEELEAWKTGIEERLKALEDKIAEIGKCECAGLLEAIEAAIAQAASAVTVSASVGAPVMTTETGDLGISCVAEVTASGGSGSVRFSY